MSEVEKHIGTLREIILPDGMTTEEWYKEQCLKNGMDPADVGPSPTQYSSWKYAFMDDVGWDFPDSCKYVTVGDKMYEMIEHEETEDDICKFWKNSDGTISFMAEFYNGGTCLSEIVEYELSKLQ